MFEEYPNMYKYYAYTTKEDKKRLEARLLGEIYFSSPLKFNDPYDCQLPRIINNTATFSRGRGRILELLKEEEFPIEETYEKLISGNKETIHEVYRRQADLLGILCLTKKYDNILMWSHYAHNNGICIEYNTKKLLEHIHSIHQRRMFVGNVVYDKLLKSNAKLFFENVSECELKYWHKLRQWKYEKEFRIGISLGGNMSIRVPNIVEHIYLGCNAPDELIRKVQRICRKNKLNISISIMTKRSKGLSPIGLQNWLSKRSK